jgi:hypothetical protein
MIVVLLRREINGEGTELELEMLIDVNSKVTVESWMSML